VSKQAAWKTDVEGFNLRKLNEGKLENSIGLWSQTSLQLKKT
jgi:hypothetical protein